jgi:hypothetical protein
MTDTSLRLALEWFRENKRKVYENAGSITESPYLRQITNEEDLHETSAGSAPQTVKWESSNKVPGSIKHSLTIAVRSGSSNHSLAVAIHFSSACSNR